MRFHDSFFNRKTTTTTTVAKKAVQFKINKQLRVYK